MGNCQIKHTSTDPHWRSNPEAICIEATNLRQHPQKQHTYPLQVDIDPDVVLAESESDSEESNPPFKDWIGAHQLEEGSPYKIQTRSRVQRKKLAKAAQAHLDTTGGKHYNPGPAIHNSFTAILELEEGEVIAGTDLKRDTPTLIEGEKGGPLKVQTRSKSNK